MMSIFLDLCFKKKTHHIPTPYKLYYEYFNHFKIHIQKLLPVSKSKTLTSKFHDTFTLMSYVKQFISSFL